MKRYIFYIPTKGPDSINRRIRKCKTLHGSKAYYQFTDIGDPDRIEIRLQSCHHCLGCRKLTDRGACGNREVCGGVERVVLTSESVAEARVTRHALQTAGQCLASGMAVGSLVVVELTNESEMFMFEVVIKAKHTITVAIQVTEMGQLLPGDEVLDVRKFEPTQMGSNRFQFTSKQFPVFVEDVRLVLTGGIDFTDEGGPRRSTRASSTSSSSSSAAVAEVHGFVSGHTYKLASHSLERILQLVPDDADDSSPNSRRN